MTSNSMTEVDSLTLLPPEYKKFLEEIKKRIREAQLRASLSVNSELVLLYWSIGNSILEKQVREGWGTKIIDRMSKDLAADFPGLSGFSVRNLRYMRKFAEVYPDPQIVQALLAQLPWWHNLLILEKLKDPEARKWYAHEVIKKGWSGRALEEAFALIFTGGRERLSQTFRQDYRLLTLIMQPTS